MTEGKWTGGTTTVYNDPIQDARLDNLEHQTGIPNTPIGYRTERIETTEPPVWEYYATFVVSFGERVAKPGTHVEVARLWANDIIIYDRSASFTAPAIANTSYPWGRSVINTELGGGINPLPVEAQRSFGFQFFDGSEDQGPVFRGMHYRGLMTGRFTDFNVTEYGNSIPTITAELIDIVDGSETNDAGDMFYRRMVEAYTAEIRSDFDALYRVHVTEQGVYVDKARLSTKAQSFGVRLMGDPSSPSYETIADPDTVFTFIPEMNAAFTQGNDNTFKKRLYDLTSGKVTAYLEWETCQVFMPFPVTAGGFKDFFVFCGSVEEVYAGEWPIGIMVVRPGSINYGWIDNFTTSAMVGAVVGPQNDGSTSLFVATANGVEELVVKSAGSDTTHSPVGVAVTRSVFYTAGVDGDVVQVWYDAARNRVIVLTDAGKVIALDAATKVTAWAVSGVTLPGAKTARTKTAEALSNLAGGTLVLSQAGSSTEVTSIDLVAGTKTDITVPDNDTVTELGPLFWESSSKALYGAGSPYVVLGMVPSVSDDPNRYNAAEVMRAYSIRAGYTDMDIATFGMDDMYVDGYIASGPVSLQMIANGLSQLYGFNWSERAGTITYKNSYVDGVLNIDATAPADRLANLTDGQNSQHFNVERLASQDFPSVLSLTYFDGDNGYKRGYNEVPGPLDNFGAVRSDMSLPLTIDAEYAQELLFAAMYRMWANQVEYQIRLPSEFIILEVGDVLVFTADNTTYTGLLDRHRINADNSVSLTVSEPPQAQYPIRVPVQPTVKVPSKAAMPIRAVLLDIPDRTAGQNRPGVVNLLVLMSGYVPDSFRGGLLDLSRGTGEWGEALAFGAAEEGYIGYLTEDLGDWAYPFETDTYNSLYVDAGTIPAAKFVNATEGQLDDGANVVALGEGSAVELVQFANADNVGGNIWRLWNLRRGRFGTELYSGVWSEGATLSFLDNAKVVNMVFPDVESGNNDLLYRAYMAKQPVWQADVNSLTVEYNSRKPYAPVNITVRRNPSNDSLRIEWTRRTRFLNSPSTPFDTTYSLDETAEEFEINIVTNSGVRVLRSDTDFAIYTASEQTSDGLSLTDTDIELAIYQISADTVGRGFGAWQELPIYALNAAVLGGKISANGNVSGNVRAVTNLAGTISAGGAIDGHFAEVVAVELSGSIAGTGTLSGAFRAMPLTGSIVGGGALSGTIPAYVLLAGVIVGGGAVSGRVAYLDFAGAVAGGGSLSGAVVVRRDLGGAVSGGGAVIGAITTPAVTLSGTIGAGGALMGNMADPVAPVELSGVIGGGGVLTGEIGEPVMAFRYLRLLFTGSYTSYIAAHEIAFRDAMDVDIRPVDNNATYVTASSSYSPSYPPTNAFNLTTGGNPWECASGDVNGWIKIDTGGAYEPTRVVYTNGPFFSEIATGFMVQGSNDDTTWTTLWEVTGNPNTVNAVSTYDKPNFIKLRGAVGAGGEVSGDMAPPNDGITGTIGGGGAVGGDMAFPTPIEPPEGPTRFWRILVDQTQNVGDAYVCIGEFEMSVVTGTPMDGSDETTGKTVLFSSEYTTGGFGGDAINAINNTYGDAGPIFSAGTAWLSFGGTGAGQYIGVDFGAGTERDIREVRILANHTNDRSIKDGRIQRSSNGVHWFDVWTLPTQSAWTMGEWRTFTRSFPEPEGNPDIGDTNTGGTTTPTVHSVSSGEFTGTSAVLDTPAELAAGDLLVFISDADRSNSGMEGWSRSGPNSIPGWIRYRLATSDDAAGATITINGMNGGPDTHFAALLCIRGVDLTTPVIGSQELYELFDYNIGTATDTPSVSIAGPNRMLLGINVLYGEYMSSGATVTGYSGSGLAEQVDHVIDGSDRPSASSRFASLYVGSKVVNAGLHNTTITAAGSGSGAALNTTYVIKGA